MQQFKHCIDLHKSCLEFPVQEYSFIAVILEDADGRQIDRRDYSGNDLMSIFNTINSTGFINIWRDIIYQIHDCRRSGLSGHIIKRLVGLNESLGRLVNLR